MQIQGIEEEALETAAPLYACRNVPVMSCACVRAPAASLAYPRRDIALFCDPATGLVSNRIFDGATQVFTGEYEETQSFSAHFSKYMHDAARDLTERHALAGKRVLEIGCGKGDFLFALARASGATCIGIDPSFRADRHGDREGLDIRFLAEPLGSQHYDLAPDLVVCRHTLEHIGDLDGFLGHIRHIMQARPGAVLYLDVPDATRVFGDGAFWDIYYEHCHYFTATSLARVLRRAGFAPTACWTVYDGQFLCVEAQVGEASATHGVPAASDDAALARGLADAADRQIAAWRAWFEARRGRRVALWGGGSKAVGFLSAADFAERVCGIIDINPHKVGTYAPGTGIAVSGPETLPALAPHDIVVMNPIYVPEIARELRRIGCSAKLWPLGPLPIAPVEV